MAVAGVFLQVSISSQRSIVDLLIRAPTAVLAVVLYSQGALLQAWEQPGFCAGVQSGLYGTSSIQPGD